MVIKKPIAAPDDGFAVLAGIPCEADSRRDVIRISWHTLDDPERVLRFLRNIIHGRKQWSVFDVVAHPVIQRHCRLDPPGVLNKESQGVVIESIVWISDSLDEDLRNAQPVRLNR